MKKKLLSILLACVVVFCAIGSASAVETRASGSAFNVTNMAPYTNKGSFVYPFEIKEDMPYFKVWCDNTGDHDWTAIAVRSGSQNGPIVSNSGYSQNLNSGDDPINVYSLDPVEPGRYYLTITVAGGYTPEGHVACRVASTFEELGF